MIARSVCTAILCGALVVACGSREERAEAHEPDEFDSGGAGEQSFEEAMRIFCDAPLHAEIPDDADPAEQMYLLAKHIDERLENIEVRALFEALANVDGPDRAEHVLEAAQRAALEACPIVDPQLATP
jgi:hypothetical protein